MEILDLSRNKISEIPNDIESLKALRVFSIQHNSIEDLPNGLGNTSTLRMLKMTGNPWEPGIKRILSTSDTTKDDNERDTMLTPKIKEHLRARAVKDSGEDARYVLMIGLIMLFLTHEQQRRANRNASRSDSFPYTASNIRALYERLRVCF